MSKSAQDYWVAASNFRMAGSKSEEKHRARVTLLRVALTPGSAGERAAALLRTEGIIVVRDTATLHTRTG